MKDMKDEKAVSPVIGVILMVVITVIIAAILAVFAFGIGAPSKAPEAKLRFVAYGGAAGTFTISSAGGDSLVLKDEKLFVKDVATGNPIAGLDNILLNTFTTPASPVYLTPGNSISIANANMLTGNIIRVQVLDVPTGQLVAEAQVTVQ